jgi:hypothetical protein
MSFKRDLENENTGLAVDLDQPSDLLLIAFSGLFGQLGPVPLFEFFNTVSRFGVKKAFVRDLIQSWYHRGVVGVGDDIPAVAEHLRELVRSSGVTRTVLVGSSAGGYAALVFGHLIDADEVHAFSPQTFIAPRLRKQYGDTRYQPYVDHLAASGGMDGNYVDIWPVLDAGAVKTQFHIYYRAPDRIETLHAGRMAEIDGVVLHPIDYDGEKLIRQLRDTGELTEILERVLEPQSI